MPSSALAQWRLEMTELLVGPSAGVRVLGARNPAGLPCKSDQLLDITHSLGCEMERGRVPGCWICSAYIYI